jgi:hypothetical protein
MREVEEKDKIINKLTTLIESNSSQVNNTENTLAIIKDECRKKDAKLQQSVDEIIKAN